MCSGNSFTIFEAAALPRIYEKPSVLLKPKSVWVFMNYVSRVGIFWVWSGGA
jgi:hypothetical protein